MRPHPHPGRQRLSGEPRLPPVLGHHEPTSSALRGQWKHVEPELLSPPISSKEMLNKISNICVMTFQEGKDKEGRSEKSVNEIMAENSPNLARDINL